MGNHKSILEKIADTVKEITTIAAEAATEALKPDEPPRKRGESSGAAYLPLAAEGLVSEPLMVPPIAVAPAPRTRHANRRAAAKKVGRRSASKATKKSSRHAKAKRSVATRPGKTAKKRTNKTERASTRKRTKTKARNSRRA